MRANPESRKSIGLGPLRVTFLLALVLSACGGKENAGARKDGDGMDSSLLRSPASTVFSGQSVVTLERHVFSDTLELPIRIEVDERRNIQVNAPAAGRIEEVFIRTQGQAVAMGDRLVLLYSPELVTAQREYLLLDTVTDALLMKQAEERLNRMGMTPEQIRSIRKAGKPMEKIPIVSPKQGFLISMQGDQGSNVADSKGGGASGMGGMSGGGMAEGNASRQSGQSAASGQSEGVIKVGMTVNRGTPVAQLNDLTQVSAVLYIPVRSASLLHAGDSVHIALKSLGLEAMSRIDFIESRVADTGGNVLAKVYLANPGFRLKLGTLGKAHVAPMAETAWVLPRSAVHTLGERQIVWVRSAKDSTVFDAQEIRIGRAGPKRVEVIEGLPPGSAVAENASLLLDPDAAIEPRPVTVKPAEDIPSQHEGMESMSHGGAHAGGSASGHSESDSSVSVLNLPKEQVLLADIRTTPAESTSLSSSQVFRAVTQFEDRSRIMIPAKSEGRIAQVYTLRPGEKIRRGQVLASLQSEALLAAQEEFLVAARNVSAISDSAMVHSQVQAAHRRLHVLGMTETQILVLEKGGKVAPQLSIVSPKDGILLEVRIQSGQYVAEGLPLFSIGISDQIWVETWMLSEEAASFPEGTEAFVQIEGISGERIKGRLEHVRQETALSGSVTLAHIALSNSGLPIMPGMQAWATFKQAGKRVLAIPNSALLRSSASTMVWVEVGKNSYASRMVKIGLETADAVEVLQGIRVGESIVISGAYLLNSEWILQKGAGMVHSGH